MPNLCLYHRGVTSVALAPVGYLIPTCILSTSMGASVVGVAVAPEGCASPVYLCVLILWGVAVVPVRHTPPNNPKYTWGCG